MSRSDGPGEATRLPQFAQTATDRSPGCGGLLHL